MWQKIQFGRKISSVLNVIADYLSRIQVTSSAIGELKFTKFMFQNEMDCSGVQPTKNVCFGKMCLTTHAHWCFTY
jgi:hypothetical protein